MLLNTANEKQTLSMTPRENEDCAKGRKRRVQLKTKTQNNGIYVFVQTTRNIMSTYRSHPQLTSFF